MDFCETFQRASRIVIELNDYFGDETSRIVVERSSIHPQINMKVGHFSVRMHERPISEL